MPHEEARTYGLMELVIRAKQLLTDLSPGEFSAFGFGKELGLSSTPDVLNMVLCDLVKDGIIEPCGSKRGQYRVVQNECREMDWHNAVTAYYPISLPLKIHEMCGVQKKNVIIVAGETNAGKTAFAVDTIHQNLRCNGGSHEQIRLYNSEMGDGELRQRVMTLDNRPGAWTGFRAFERSRDFHQVIDPNGFNVIDYLEVANDFFRVAEWIQRIHERLNEGIAIICLQKPKGKDVGRGGEFSLEKARLAISLFYNHGIHSCKIVKCKLPLGLHGNPQGMECDYCLEKGGRPVRKESWRYLTEKERCDLWKKYEKEAAARQVRGKLGF